MANLNLEQYEIEPSQPARNMRISTSRSSCLAQRVGGQNLAASGKGPPMASTPTPPHVLTEVTCPHCQKKNLVAVVKPSPVTNYEKSEVFCAYCGKTWEALLEGPIFAGPFPK